MDDNQTMGPSFPSTWWKLEVMIDIEAPTAADVREDTVGHTYIKFSESNGLIYTYGFYPVPGYTPNIMRTKTFGCLAHPDNFHAKCVDYTEVFNLNEQEYEKSLSLAQLFCIAGDSFDLYSNLR